MPDGVRVKPEHLCGADDVQVAVNVRPERLRERPTFTFVLDAKSVGAAAAAGMSSQCPVHTAASSSQAAVIVKMSGFAIRAIAS